MFTSNTLLSFVFEKVVCFWWKLPSHTCQSYHEGRLRTRSVNRDSYAYDMNCVIKFSKLGGGGGGEVVFIRRLHTKCWLCNTCYSISSIHLLEMCVPRKWSECLPSLLWWNDRLYFSGAAGVDRDTHQPHHEGRGHQGLFWDCPRTQQRHCGGCWQHLHVCLLPGERYRRATHARFWNRSFWKSKFQFMCKQIAKPNSWVCLVHLLLSAHWL